MIHPKVSHVFIKKMGRIVLVVLPMVFIPLLAHLFVQGTIKSLVKNQNPGDSDNPKTQALEIAKLAGIEDASSEIDGKWKGVCKKNSIHSVEDFKKTVQSDPVLSNHFAGFNWATARLEKQDKEIFAYVTHREGTIIQLTTKPIRLPKDDGYITDGVHAARTYCCNDIEMKPTAGAPAAPVDMAPTAGAPAAPIDMAPPAGAPADPIGMAPPAGAPASPFNITPLSGAPIGAAPITSLTPANPPNVPTISTVPEPNSMLLFVIGIASLAGVSFKKRYDYHRTSASFKRR